MATIINMGGPRRPSRVELSSDDDLSDASTSSIGSQEEAPYRKYYHLGSGNNIMGTWRWTFGCTTNRIVYREGARGYEPVTDTVDTSIAASTTVIVANREEDETMVEVSMKDIGAVINDAEMSYCEMTMVFPSGSEVKITLYSELHQVLVLCVDELKRIL